MQRESISGSTTKKYNRLQSREPKLGLFWCLSCDRYLLAKGGKCKVCGYKDKSRRKK
jgi:hypothetical protein